MWGVEDDECEKMGTRQERVGGERRERKMMNEWIEKRKKEQRWMRVRRGDRKSEREFSGEYFSLGALVVSEVLCIALYYIALRPSH